MNNCPQCGKQFDGDECPMCGGSSGADTAERSESGVNPFVERLPKKAGNAIKKAKDIDVGKYGLISLLIIAVFAIVFIAVALSAPVKVRARAFEKIEDASGGDGEPTKATVSFFDVDQTIWRFYQHLIVGSELDVEQMDKMLKEYNGALEEAKKELDKWLSGQNADKLTEAEINNKLYETLADKLGDTNFLWIMSTLYSVEWDDDHSAIIKGDPQIIAVNSSAIMGGTIVAAIQTLIAVAALVFVVLAVFGMLRKKPKKLFFKMLGAIFVISMAAVAVTAVMPGLSVGGGTLAIAVTSAAAYFVLGVGYALTYGNTSALVVLKKSVLAALLCVSAFLLCTDIFELTMSSSKIVAAVDEYGKLVCDTPVLDSAIKAYGDAGIFDCFIPSRTVTDYMLRNTYLAKDYSAEYLYIVCGLAVLASATAYQTVLSRLVTGDKPLTGKQKLRSPKLYMILSILLVAATAAFAMTSFGGEAKAVIEQIKSVGKAGTFTAIAAECAVCVQLYVSAALAVIAFVFDLAFRPERKKSANAVQAAD